MRRSRSYADYLRDILDSIGKIESFVSGMDLEKFSTDDKTVFAVVRALEVIGEAAKNVPAEARRKHAEIPWREMIGMRNIVIHEYFGVDNRVVWKTTQEDLPRLKSALSQVLKKESESTGR